MCITVPEAGRQELFPKLPNTVPNDVYEETWDEDDLSDSEGAEAIPGAANADLQDCLGLGAAD